MVAITQIIPNCAKFIYEIIMAVLEGTPFLRRFVHSKDDYIEYMPNYSNSTRRLSPNRSRNSIENKNILTKVRLPRKKILVLDLDETLIHSTMQLDNCDMKVTVIIEGQKCVLNVIKRPHVQRFLRTVSEWYHVIIFTASVQAYGDPVIDMLDPYGYVQERLFRPRCVNRNGTFVKDLSVIHKDLSQVIIIDNSPIAYSINPENAIPISNWFGTNINDEALLNLLPFLDALRWTRDVRSILKLRLQR